MRILVAVLMLLAGVMPLRAAESAAALERGTAIIDPLALRALDAGRFALGHVLAPARPGDAPLASGELFDLPSMAAVRKALDAEFDRYISRHKTDLPNESIGVGTAYDVQLFDRAPLYSGSARFVLTGIVNRMDRAYVSEAHCGEIRLLYRLVRTDIKDVGIGAPEAGEGAISPRLPMTLNIVLKAKADDTGDAAAGRGKAFSCAEIARRWLAAGDWPQNGAELAEKLIASDGPLDLVRPENIDRIETNIQIAHAPKSAVRDFRTDYLFKVFDYNAATRAFEESPLENQIDREKIMADDKLRSDFKAWLLDPRHLQELDRGTILFPDRFLATAAIGPTPVGFAPSSLQPEFGLVEGEGTSRTGAVFSASDVEAALKRAVERGEQLANIRSLAGFERRLNDVTCSGCHQTRGIGGFHFPGVDWMVADPNNSTIVPASPHFFGDQVRRRDIVTAFRDGRQPDFSHGFAARPQLRGSTELAGTQYDDGWGAHCYIRHPDAADNDASFASWNCAEGLTCQPMDKTSRVGMCFIGER